MKTTEHRRTRHFNIMLILLALAGLIGAWVALDPMAWAGQRSDRHGWAGQASSGHMVATACSRGSEDHIAEAAKFIGLVLELNATQAAAWDHVTQELELGLAGLRDACEGLANNSDDLAMPERLVYLESTMAAGAETLRAMRPAFETFYETLDDSQRQRLDAMFRSHAPQAR